MSRRDTVVVAETLWFALCMASAGGLGISELMRVADMSRLTLYRYLARPAQASRAVQVSLDR